MKTIRISSFYYLEQKPHYIGRYLKALNLSPTQKGTRKGWQLFSPGRSQESRKLACLRYGHVHHAGAGCKGGHGRQNHSCVVLEGDDLKVHM